MSSVSWFAQALAPWYAANRRSLPWRSTRDPYLIWLSEVILQQTRVDQGLAYYNRFALKYPTVHHLAAATEDEVLKDWQGLGYYSRARNMRATAQRIVSEYRGVFPEDHNGLRHLKGIGPYTAAAIASIAFNEPVAVVDGNVFRVLARCFGIREPIDRPAGKRLVADLASRLLDRKHPGEHNQAVMELGALVCTPKRPQCNACPVRSRCLAYEEGVVEQLPLKVGRTKVRERHFNYLLPHGVSALWLVKRAAGDIWQGLYTPPMVESDVRWGARRMQAALQQELGRSWHLVGSFTEERHVLSHQVIHARFWWVSKARTARLPADWLACGLKDAHRYPVPRLVERVLGEVLNS
ncbi:MAG: A/G-specific adenine glycosylase [Flavobacteriales bacterium]|nr:A/G-specific adenine glycosylase [Flavobacteriales bacterium]